MFQMCFDWIFDEVDWWGYIIRVWLADTEYIEVMVVHLLFFVSEAPINDFSTIVLIVTNMFDWLLSVDVEFSLYYEGGVGKPMPKFEP